MQKIISYLCSKLLSKYCFKFLVTTSLSFTAMNALSEGDRVFQFSIKAQALDAALLELGEQSGISIIGQAQTTENFFVDNLEGQMTLSQALKTLLEETNIQYEYVKDDIIVLTSLTAQNTDSTRNENSPIDAKENAVHIEETYTIGPRITQQYQDQTFNTVTLSGIEVTNQQITNLQDIRSVVPGVQFIDIADHNAVKLFIRGITTFDYTETGDQSIGHYRDGIYHARTQTRTPLIYDVERIEVLRGPQGWQYGRSSIGGAVNIYSNKPSNEINAQGTFTLGSDNYLYSEMATNLPITENWALRVAGAIKNRDGDIAFEDTESLELQAAEPYGTIDLSSYRISSLFTPNDDFKWFLSFESFSDNGTGSVPTTTSQNRVTEASTPGRVDFKMDSLKTRLDYKINNFAMSYIGGGAKFERSQLWSPSFLDNLGDHTANTRWLDNDSYQHEVHFRSVDPINDKLSWLLGFYYFKEQSDTRFDLQEPIDVAAANGELRSQISYIQPNRQAISKSAFLRLDYSIREDLRLISGLRYSDDEKFDIGGRSIFCTQHFNQALPEAAPSKELRTDEPCWIGAYNDASGTWDGVTGSAKLEWERNDDQLLYLSYASGWKPGNVVDGIDTEISEGTLQIDNNNQLSLQDEHNYVIEAGFHNSFAENKLHLNANAFYMRHKNMQATTYAGESPLYNGNYIRNNDAHSRVFGLELNLNWSMANNWRTSSSLSLLNSRYTKLISSDPLFSDREIIRQWNTCDIEFEDGSCAINMKGNELPFTPTVSAFVDIERAIALKHAKLTPSAKIYTQTKMFFSPENRKHRAPGTINAEDPGELYYYSQPAYTTLDLRLRYEPLAQDWQIDIFANNVTDTEIKQGTEFEGKRVDSVYYWSSPRTFGIRFSSHFL